MTDTEHAGQVVSDLVLGLILAVHLIDELVESLTHGVHVNLVLLEHSFGNFVSHIAINILASGHEVLLYASQ